MVTSHDVARLAGVSQPTVSRALADNPRVSAATRERVRRAARELGYVPSATGRALSLGRSHRVGLLVTDLRNQYYPHIIAPVHHQLRSHGYELILMTDEDPAGQVADRVRANGLDGVILATATIDSPVPVRLRDRGIPFVYFNRVSSVVAADAVTVDPRSGLHEMVCAIKDLGHRTVGAIFGPANASTGANRAQALRAEVASAGILLRPEHTAEGDFTTASGSQGLRQVMAADDPPTVVWCANDVVAIGAYNAALELGLRIPQDLSIVGFDDLPEASWPILQLSTVAFDLAGMARRATDLMAVRIEEPSSENPDEAEFEQVVFTSHFVARRSLGPAPTPR